MERVFFLTTDRIGFSKWQEDDISLATLLWGEAEVTKWICASGIFDADEISCRLEKEIRNDKDFNIQYWPIFELKSKELIGCCGLRPYNGNSYEIGFHLRQKFWGQGYATEAARAALSYAFNVLSATEIFAGHHPNNSASSAVLKKLGFNYTDDEFYEPTGLYHPSYTMRRGEYTALSANPI